MIRYRYATAAIIFSLTIAACMPLRSQSPLDKPGMGNTSAADIWPTMGASLTALLNTAEADYHQTRGTFSNHIELLKPGTAIQKKLMEIVAPSDRRDIRWDYRIYTSADGKHYQLFVSKEPSAKCESAFYSSENQIVYQGKQTGCE